MFEDGLKVFRPSWRCTTRGSGHFPVFQTDCKKQNWKNKTRNKAAVIQWAFVSISWVPYQWFSRQDLFQDSANFPVQSFVPACIVMTSFHFPPESWEQLPFKGVLCLVFTYILGWNACVLTLFQYFKSQWSATSSIQSLLLFPPTCFFLLSKFLPSRWEGYYKLPFLASEIRYSPIWLDNYFPGDLSLQLETCRTADFHLLSSSYTIKS